MIPLGTYEHYKKRRYEVIGIARHSETEEEMVLYRPLYGDGGLWVRPLSMFCETVTIENREVKRFTYLGDAHG